MKLRTLAVMLLLAGCGSDKDSTLPPPAEFSDATADTGGKKDSGIDSSTPDTSSDVMVDDTLLADASDVMPDAPDCVIDKTCVGAPMPTWQLRDFQPKSARYNQTYGLEGFKGKVTVVALLSGW